MSALEETNSNAPSGKQAYLETSRSAVTEYDEYLGLCEVMTGDRLKKLVRKVE